MNPSNRLKFIYVQLVFTDLHHFLQDGFAPPGDGDDDGEQGGDGEF